MRGFKLGPMEILSDAQLCALKFAFAVAIVRKTPNGMKASEFAKAAITPQGWRQLATRQVQLLRKADACIHLAVSLMSSETQGMVPLSSNSYRRLILFC